MTIGDTRPPKPLVSPDPDTWKEPRRTPTTQPAPLPEDITFDGVPIRFFRTYATAARKAAELGVTAGAYAAMVARAAEAARIREKYPDRIPVICEREPRSNIPPVDKRKYLIPMDLTVGQFVYVIRKRISIPPEKAIFIFVNNTLPPSAALMSTVYVQHRDADGFMCDLRPTTTY